MAKLNRLVSVVSGLILAVSIVNCGGSSSTPPPDENPPGENPVVTVGGDQTVDEGSQVSFAGTFSDPDAGDTHTYEWDFGDGNANATTLTPAHTYLDDGIYTVTLTVTDNVGMMGTDSLEVTVNNVAPTITPASDPAAILEGGSVSFTAPVVVDPGADDTFTYSWDFGDLSAVSTSTAPSHTYADDGSFTAIVTVTDDDGGEGTNSLTVTVNNAAPVVSAGDGDTIDEGDQFAGSGSFTDAGVNDSWSATVNYGAGGGPAPLVLSGQSFALAYTYYNAGAYTVTVTVSDSDGGTDSDTLTVTVNPLLSISGAITGIPSGFQASVKLSGTADSTTTTVSGDYSFGDLRNGTYTVTPQLGGQLFSPADTTVTLSGSDSSGNDFDIPYLVRFVDQDSPASTPDGMSWATAYPDPQLGSDFASSGDQVWVAEGSYASADTSVATVPVLMMKSGVEYYGGFAATETLLSERDLSAHTTTLDGLDITDQIVIGADNSLLSGFDVANAYVNTLDSGRENAPVNASLLTGFRIHDCRITGNLTRADSSQIGSSGLNISDGEVVNCVFNYNQGRNAPIYIIRTSTGDVDIINSLFHDNSAMYGGGIVVGGTGDVRIINTTIADNTSTNINGGPGIFMDRIAAPAGTPYTTYIKNSIVRGVIDGITNYELPTITFSNIEGGSTTGTSIDADPLFINAASDDYQLYGSSLCIDVGNDADVPFGITEDLAGEVRFDGIVDMGAYEYVHP